MGFEILSRISEIETIAAGSAIREIARLRRIYGPVDGGSAKASHKSALRTRVIPLRSRSAKYTLLCPTPTRSGKG
jgi:hypothetical protein